MKNTITTILAFISALCLLSGCGSSESSSADTTNTTAAETTTTTTTVTTTAEPETTTETTTTTEATTTTAEPENSTETDTDTEAKTTEAPADETTVVTMADNPDGMYTVEECFRRKAEEVTGKKVVEFDNYVDEIPHYAILDDGGKALLTMPVNAEDAVDSDSNYSIGCFNEGAAVINGYDCVIEFIP
ncbi:MAG: hypothetical protein J6I46_08620 [Ruminococcus sp.]|nr:hypothetical protein [Ruminococcus sp.]